jgi:hypothetical protein
MSPYLNRAPRTLFAAYLARIKGILLLSACQRRVRAARLTGV